MNKAKAESYIGKRCYAADGGGYSIIIVGHDEDTDDFLVVNIGKTGKVIETDGIRRLDCFKATYRYMLDEGDINNH
jgi:hypothetical protein